MESAYAQQPTMQSKGADVVTLRGFVKDTSQGIMLETATVMLLRQSDSVMLAYTKTAKDGSFKLSIEKLNMSSCLIMVSYPKYADWVDRIDFSSSERDMGTIPMNTKAFLMKEIIIKNTAPIRIKGDTTEYIADSFRVSANADVQELLRRMPGIQVNAKGEIVAQGQKVEKMLVDGEEFFSDDPAIVAKTLRADIVKKVQVYDRKSDQAEFTGVDDGKRTKTINIELKEDKKNGYFGKAELGSNFQKYNAGKLMVNSFKGSRKVAGHIVSSNTTSQALDWNEASNYGESNAAVSAEDGGVSISLTSEDINTGYPTVLSGGGLFSDKWKDFTTSNTFTGKRLGVDMKSDKIQKTILSDQTQTNHDSSASSIQTSRFTVKSVDEISIDSTTKLNIIAKFTKSNTENITDQGSQTFKNDDFLLNDLDKHLKNAQQKTAVDLTLSLRKKYAKMGRSLSFVNTFNAGNTGDESNIKAVSRFYNLNGTVARQDVLDQFKTNNSRTSSIQSNLTYTEPISTKTSMLFQYTLANSSNDAERSSFNKSLNGKYEEKVDSLSNHFNFGQLINTARASFQYNYKKWRVNAGSGIGIADYSMKDLSGAKSRSESFKTFLPAAQFQFKKSQATSLSVSYYGSTINPQLNQLQPIVDNSNPLYINIGNPLLKQAFRHDVYTSFRNYSNLKGRYFDVSINGSATDREIVSSTQVDQEGKIRAKFINVNGNYNYSTRVNYSLNIIKGFSAGTFVQYRFNKMSNEVNGFINTSKINKVEFNFNGYFSGLKWFEGWFNFSPTNVRSSSSIQKSIVTNYWEYPLYFNLNFKFDKIGTKITLSGDMMFYQKTPTFSNPVNSPVLTPAIRKTFSKDKNWEAKLMVYDLFNKRQFVNRNANSNFIIQQTTNGIRRYAMLSLIYNFSKNGKETALF
jgi:hypothetical protein